MAYYKCAACGRSFNPERDEICPRCGTIVAPSVLAQVERKQTAARLRADALENEDSHCHEDDAWLGSYAAQAHRARTAAWHESSAQGGNPYNAASQTPTASMPRQPAPPPTARSSRSSRTKKPNLAFLIPLLIVIWWIIHFIRLFF